MTLLGLILSNSLIALGGAMFSQYQGFCDISQGIGTLVTGLASVVIGQKILPFRIEPRLILSCIVGSVLYRIFISVALHSDILWIRTQDLNLITGIIIVAIMLTKKSQNAKA
jgi:putative ABC transport system permease protein